MIVTENTAPIVWNTASKYPSGDQVQSAPDHVLIMELLKRGYAVARMPPEQLVGELTK